MPILPIDNRISMVNTGDAGRMRDGQLKHEEGLNKFAQENIRKQEELEQSVKPSLEAEQNDIQQDDDKNSNQTPLPKFPKPQNKEEPEIPNVSDGVRGLFLDIRG